MSNYDDIYNLSKLIRHIEMDTSHSKTYLLDEYFEKMREKEFHEHCPHHKISFNSIVQNIQKKLHLDHFYNLKSLSFLIFLSGLILVCMNKFMGMNMGAG